MAPPRSLLTVFLVLLAVTSYVDAGCVLDTIKQYPELGSLVKALEASDLGEALSSSSNVVTLLAPTDIAWQKLSLATNLNASEILSNGVGLNVALGHHLLSGVYTIDMLQHGLEIPTLVQDATVVVSVIGEGQFAPGTYITSKFGTPARVTTPNIMSPDCISVVHMIDEVLLAEETGPALGISWATDSLACNGTAFE